MVVIAFLPHGRPCPASPHCPDPPTALVGPPWATRTLGGVTTSGKKHHRTTADPADKTAADQPGTDTGTTTAVGANAGRGRATGEAPAPSMRLLAALLAGSALVYAARLWSGSATTSEYYPDALDFYLSYYAYALATIVPAAITVGAALGLVVQQIGQGRRGRAARWWLRLLGGLGVGLVTGAALGGLTYAAEHSMSEAARVAAFSVALAGLVGGLISAIRPAQILTGALAGALGVAVTQVILAFFTTPLRRAFDGGGSASEVIEAQQRISLIGGLLAGLVAGVLAHLLLRGSRVGLPGRILTGGGAGAFLLIGEVITQNTQDRLVSAGLGIDIGNFLILELLNDARFNGALIIFFAGAVTAVLALGRERPSAKRLAAKQAAARKAAERDAKLIAAAERQEARRARREGKNPEATQRDTVAQKEAAKKKG